MCVAMIQPKFPFEGKCQYKVEKYFCILQILKTEQTRPSLIPFTTREFLLK